jgi:hypothetical protein
MSGYKPGNVVAVRAAYLRLCADAHIGGHIALIGGDEEWTANDEIAPWPDAERMALLEALVATVRNLDAPMVEAIEFNWCAYCHKSDPATLADHEPDCEWRLLREAAL